MWVNPVSKHSEMDQTPSQAFIWTTWDDTKDSSFTTYMLLPAGGLEWAPVIGGAEGEGVRVQDRKRDELLQTLLSPLRSAPQ